VSHASALAAIAEGPPDGVDSAPLSGVKTLTLSAVANDPVSLAKTLAASPRASTIKLRRSGSDSGLWDLLHTAASAGPPGEGGARRHHMRRVHFEMDFVIAVSDPDAATPCIRALFPRVRYASWGASGLPHTALF
jgi:hypothetical protein